MGSGEIPAPESCLVAPRGMGCCRDWPAAEAPQQVPGMATLLGISPYPRPIMNRRTRSWEPSGEGGAGEQGLLRKVWSCHPPRPPAHIRNVTSSRLASLAVAAP